MANITDTVAFFHYHAVAMEDMKKYLFKKHSDLFLKQRAVLSKKTFFRILKLPQKTTQLLSTLVQHTQKGIGV